MILFKFFGGLPRQTCSGSMWMLRELLGTGAPAGEDVNYTVKSRNLPLGKERASKLCFQNGPGTPHGYFKDEAAAIFLTDNLIGLYCESSPPASPMRMVKC